MTSALAMPALPFRLDSSQPDVWQFEESTGTLTAQAPGRTDLYVNPGGDSSGDAESLLNAAMLVGSPTAEDFQFRARVSVDFIAKYDAGVLMVWIDDQHWAKFCFEYSPDGEPMVVSVVTREFSDDANAFVVERRTAWLRISRVDRVYAFHASTDGVRWQFIRAFTLGGDVHRHLLGFEVQAPTGDGCTVTFDHIDFATTRLGDLRDGT